MKKVIILCTLVWLVLLSGIFLPSITTDNMSQSSTEVTLFNEPVTLPQTEPPVETTVPTESTEPTQDPETLKWEGRYAEYPVATTVWKHLTEVMGYNNYVAAGIMGNIMSECGGQTLNIQWEAYSNSGFYGLCQWSYYFPEVIGADLQGQLDFMTHSFPDEIDYWGTICYKNGFTHDDFMNLQSAEEAAYAFCVIYERPLPGGEYQRQKNALEAYNYFTS